MRCYIGIDGGGTKTALRAVDEDNNTLVEAVSGSTNMCSNNKEEVYVQLKNLWNSARESYEKTLEPVSICMGVAGTSKKGVIFAITQMLESVFQCKSVIVVGDMELTLSSYINQNVVALVAGTGSICYARNKENEFWRVGGHGHILGDRGSSYHVGILALQHILHRYDLLLEDDLLTKRICKNTKFNNKDSIISYVYGNNYNKKEVAELCKIVEQVASMQDRVALDILDIAAEGLFSMVKDICLVSQLTDETFDIILLGGFLKNCSYVADKVYNKIAEQYHVERISLPQDLCWQAINRAKGIKQKER